MADFNLRTVEEERQRQAQVDAELRRRQQISNALQRQLDLERQVAGSARSQTMADIEAGRRFGRDVLGEEGLGRLGTDPEIQGVLDRFKGISEEGLGTAETVAKRERALEGIGQSTQTAERALLARLGSAGVRGASAGAQLRELQVQGLRARAGVERDLFLESEQLKRSGLKDFAEALGQVKTFDLGQAAKEKDIEISAGLGVGQLGQAERSAMAQAEAQRQAAAQRAAASCFRKGTLIETIKGLSKIEDLQPGDILSNGNPVEIVGKGYGHDFYLWRGLELTAEHPVYENGWVEVQYAQEAEKLPYGEEIVYNVFCGGDHSIVANNQRVGDYASIYTLGGMGGVINNFFQKLRVSGLRAVKAMVGKLGLVSS